jgi:hypothetical protein
MNEQQPLPAGAAVRAVARGVLTACVLLLRGRVHHPRAHVGTLLRFADGTTAPVYRETVIDRPAPRDPCVLVVEFRLRAVRGRGHALFQPLSLLNTPLFVGFPGLVSKFWLANDRREVYRGVYEWDGPERAEAYARALWRVLALVSARGSIHYRVVPGIGRDDLLADPHVLDDLVPAATTGQEGWWRPVGVA